MLFPASCAAFLRREGLQKLHILSAAGPTQLELAG